MNEFDFSKLGEHIGKKVETALHSKQVEDLKENIKKTVHTTVDDVTGSLNETFQHINQNNNPAYQKNTQQPQNHPYVPPKKLNLPVVKKPQGSTAGVLLTVFGSIGSGVFGVLMLLGIASAILLGGSQVTAVVLCGVALLWLANTLMIAAGRSMWGEVRRFRNYIKAMNGKAFCDIKQLSVFIGKKEKFVVKDLKRMMEKRWFLEGHLDEQNICFMATNEAYQQYLETQAALKQRQEEELEQKRKEEAALLASPEEKALLQIEAEGKEYIAQIRKANEDIPGEIVSAKLERLEMISSKIFEQIKRKPDKVPEIRRYMNYYMPTVLKLVNTYREFDGQPLQGENITKGKIEIENSLENVNNAFEKLFDQLFQEEMLDVSADISVLSTMLSKDGLLGNDFK